MDNFLSKSFGRRSLSDVLREWLGRAASRRAGRDLTEAVESLPVLDVSVFHDLRESLRWSHGRLQHVCRMFVSSVEELSRLLDDSAAVDRHALSRHLHALLGSSGMIGARQVEYLVRRLKGALDLHPQAYIPPVSGLLRTAARHFVRAFEAQMQSGSPPEHAHPGSGTRQGE